MPGSRSKLVPVMLGPVAAALVLAGSVPAAAQYYPAPHVVYVPAPPPPSALGPHHADAVVRSLGLRPVGRAQGRGSVFVVHALGQEGSPVVVTLDRSTGRVLQIVRTGYGAPRIAVVPPAGAPPYDPYDDEEEIASLDERELPPGAYPEARGPAVITRRGIEADELPAPGPSPRYATRDPYATGSVPRGVYRSPPRGADPLAGVPKEFRGEGAKPAPVPEQRMAARPLETAPRAAPLPRPRPSDAPAVARVESVEEKSSQPAAKFEPQEPALSPAAREDVEKFPPVQGFE